MWRREREPGRVDQLQNTFVSKEDFFKTLLKTEKKQLGRVIDVFDNLNKRFKDIDFAATATGTRSSIRVNLYNSTPPLTQERFNSIYTGIP